jgi:hypothetical protein
MITSLFRKSTPFNYALVALLMLTFFFLYHFQDVNGMESLIVILQKTGLFFLLLGSLFLTNFMAKKNGLSRDSTYVVLFYFLLLLFFPSILNNPNLLLSNFFILLTLRRLISLQSLQFPKEKIFDASAWVFIAALFHFWSILFIILVFVAILFHVARDYRIWLLPFLAFFSISVLFLLFAILFDKNAIGILLQSTYADYNIGYFTNNYQNVAFSIFVAIALFFLVSLLLTFSSKPIIVHASYKKIIISFFIGVAIFIISPDKSNDLLVFTFAPLAIMATSHIETAQLKLQKEIIVSVFIICSLFTFFSQL